MENGRIADMGNSSPYRAEVEHSRKKGIWKVTAFLSAAHSEIQTYLENLQPRPAIWWRPCQSPLRTRSSGVGEAVHEKVPC